MILFQNGYLYDPETNTEGFRDILIDGKTILKIGEPGTIPKPEQTVDIRDCKIAPGLVDIHVHFRDPGFTHKEDIFTGAAAAAKGGFTTVVLMANTKPPVDNAETLSYVLDRGRKTAIHVETCACVTKGMQGKELTDMSLLCKNGAAGFTDDGIGLLSEDIVRQAMLEAKRLDVPLSFHEENPRLIQNNGVNAGRAAAYFGIGGSGREAEIDLTERDIQLALETGAKVNIQHISSKEAVELVRQAKARGGQVYAEATPHHFALTEEAVMTKGTLAKMNPPLREETDRLAIIEGLKDGTIDFIATDHAPHSAEEKALDITRAPSGIIGLETALPLGITCLVRTGRLSMMELLRKMTWNPAQLYGLPAGMIKEGGPADFIVFDDQQCFTVQNFASKSANSPFIGETLYGVVHYTVCAGSIAYQLRKEMR